MKILKQTATNSYVLFVLKNIVSKYLEYVIEAGKSIYTYDVDKEIIDAFRDCLYGERYVAHSTTGGNQQKKYGLQDLDEVFTWFDGLSYEDKEAAIRGIVWAITESGGWFHDPRAEWTLKEQHEYIAKQYCTKFLEKISDIRGYSGVLRPTKIANITFLITVLADAYDLEQHVDPISGPRTHVDKDVEEENTRLMEKDD